MTASPSRLTISLWLSAGVIAISTSSILVRLAYQAAQESSAPLSLIFSALRVTAASLILLPAWRRVKPARLEPGALLLAGLAGVFLGVHFATFISSLAFTSIAASTALVNTNPVWVALLSWWWLAERPSRVTILGIIIALAGGTMIAVGDSGGATAGSRPLLGDVLAILGALTASVYFLLGRAAQRRGLGIGAYAAVAYSAAALVLLPLPLLAGRGYTGLPIEVYGLVLLMALIPQLVGHTSFNWAIRHISPTVVAVVFLFEPVGSSLLGYWLFAEIPGLLVIGGAAVLLVGVACAVTGTRKRKAKVAQPA